jgi:hypothetical protein
VGVAVIHAVGLLDGVLVGFLVGFLDVHCVGVFDGIVVGQTVGTGGPVGPFVATLGGGVLLCPRSSNRPIMC